MTGRGGRDRFRRDYPPKFEDKPHSGRTNPPSRHLWVGNLSHSIAETDLTEHFLRFGELDTVAFQPGRSYAFINFKQEEDAIAAITSLKGSPIDGKPLRIEFAKADKSSASQHDEEYLPRRDEQRSGLRGSPFSQRDSRARHASPVLFYPEKSKMSDTSGETEPSEVLWIGFPSLLQVDEVILKKAFSPFGEIEKITAFPGRSYAFVRFKNLMSACRAKETLQGKLFGNPRVNICFAKSEAGSSNSGRSSINTPLPPHFKSNGRPESTESFQQDRTFGGFTRNPRIRSPKFGSNLDFEDSDGYGFSRKGGLQTSENNEFEHRWFGDVDSELGLPPDMYEKPSSPTRERGVHFPDVFQKFPQKGAFLEDQLDLPEDAYFFHGAKKLKTSSFPSEKELPDYPFSDLEQEKRALPRLFSDFPQPEGFDKNFESRSFGYKQTADHTMNLNPYGERIDPWRASHDSFQVGSGSLPSNPIERKRFPPESDQPSLNEWKWEGTIAKGGTPVCRARCFPVGKVMDILLPEFLDCTARTGLEMLAKHYYQAASAWVVFFVPESDADMGFYNEFMHYLGEKQRAAVAKLDDKTTLFLVPPSDFSVKVLKVPGKLSISGVVLRLEHPGSNFGSLHHPHERKDTNLSFQGDASFPKPSTPWGPYPTNACHQDLSKSGVGNISFLGNAATPAPPASFSGSAHATESISNPYNENRHEYPLHQQNSSSGSSWPPHPLQNSVSGIRNIRSQVSNSVTDPTIQEHHSVIPMALQETSSGHYTGGISSIPFSGNSGSSFQETQPSVPLSMPVAALQPEQLAQLASSLLGKQRQSSNTPNVSTGEDFRQTNTMNQSDYPFGTSPRYALPNNQVTSELSTSQFTQGPQFQQQTSNLSSVPQTTQRELQTGIQENQGLQSTGTQEAEADPQKRLQATLQLAAALLQQIQQGKGT